MLFVLTHHRLVRYAQPILTPGRPRRARSPGSDASMRGREGSEMWGGLPEKESQGHCYPGSSSGTKGGEL
jgi:hypothetical protein